MSQYHVVASLFWLAMLFFPAPELHAQTDTLRSEILNYKDEQVELIKNGRLLMADAIEAGDTLKALEVYDYLHKVVNADEYLVLYPAEEWLISYWAGRYRKVLDLALEYDTLRIHETDFAAQPPSDRLFANVTKVLRNAPFAVSASIRSANLLPDERDFLLLHFDFLMMYNGGEDIDQNTLNGVANKFLADHPNSVHARYVKNFIRVEWVRSKWGMGAEFLLGHMQLQDGLANRFTNQTGFGLGIDYYMSRVTIYGRLLVGFGKTADTLLFAGVRWPEGESTVVGNFELSAGYNVLSKDRFTLTPFAGISSTGVTAPTIDIEDHPQYESVGLKGTRTYTMGLNLDLHVGNQDWQQEMYGFRTGYGLLRIRYSYLLPQFADRYPAYDGPIHMVTVGFGFSGFGVSRK